MAELTFINETGSASKTDESRARVRSHVMRDYYRRQWRRPSSQSQGLDAQPARRDDFHGDGGVFAVLIPPKRSHGRSRKAQLSARSTQAMSSTTPKVVSGDGTWLISAQQPSITSPSRSEACSGRIIEATDEDKYEAYETRCPSPKDLMNGVQFVPHKNGTLNNRQLGKLYHAVNSYFELISFDNGTVAEVLGVCKNYWLSRIRSSELVLVTSALVQESYVDEMPQIMTKEKQTHKVHALERINKELRKSPHMVGDELICATLCLNMFEISSGSSSVPIHFNGIQKMLELQTGLGFDMKTMNPHTPMLHLHDFIWSICDNVNPTFTATDTPMLYKPCPSHLAQHAWMSSPMQMNAYTSQLDDEHLSAACTNLITDMFDLTQILYARGQRAAQQSLEQSHARYAVCYSAAKERLDSLPMLDLALLHSSTVSQRVAEACRLAAVIHYRAVVKLIPHHWSVNHPEFYSLIRVLRSLGFRAWTRMPNVYLWM
ncbi:hypothetical protein K490DRAFT_66074 [Saccharata proteae CBS 121410]|uniref:Uncharacterized protein n=1 Tax=Saccharata proteae CBS 121410 TaxID=1314787 RepID=A0A9P4LV73_9PEZI|nr:hypothetical protein K490DRAFT_66074 [Saccharata proteae CBS 121410]